MEEGIALIQLHPKLIFFSVFGVSWEGVSPSQYWEMPRYARYDPGELLQEGQIKSPNPGFWII